MALRGVRSAVEAEAYLDPSVDRLHEPLELAGLDAQVHRLGRAIDTREAVCIVGDYDVDGVSASALLKAVFDSLGLPSRVLLPDRFRHGYGFHPEFVEQARAAGCRLILTVDCGSNAPESAEAALAARLDVMVLDHHRPFTELPAGVLHVNPSFEPEGSAFRWLSAAGLAFELAMALGTSRGAPVAPERLLRVACLGTIADMVPLTAENRLIAAAGLAALGATTSPGLQALFASAGIRPPFAADDVGFRIGPRLNAAGRMAHADSALELLLARDGGAARQLAERLELLNRQRQTEEMRVVEMARKGLLARGELPPLLMAWDPSWHPGVVGIAAGRLAREFHRPTILLVDDGELAIGSGRSVPGVDLHGFLVAESHLLTRFGGHAQAIGLTMHSADLEALRSSWEAAAEAWPAESLEREIQYDHEVTVEELTPALLAQIRRLEPFGQGNPEPVLRLETVQPLGAARHFGRGHVELQVRGSGDSPLRVLGWRWAERAEIFERPFEALGHLEEDPFHGGTRFRLRDARPVETEPPPARE